MQPGPWHPGRVRAPLAAAALVAGLLAAVLVATATAPARAATVLPTKVLVLVEENHDSAQAVAQMPYLRSLAAQYGRTTAYRGVAHPSLPNYLAIAGGSTFGVRDDRGPGAHAAYGASVLGQALGRHRTAKAYVDAMPRPCALSPYGRYAVKHNPWAYFRSERTACGRYDVPLGRTTGGALRHDADAGTLPTVGMVVPDLCHDGHDCSLATADGWLRAWLPVVLRGPDFRSGRLAVVVTFDEDDSTGTPSPVLTTVLHRDLHGKVVRTALSHYSLSRWLSEVSGSAPLRDARYATSLGRAFGLR